TKGYIALGDYATFSRVIDDPHATVEGTLPLLHSDPHIRRLLSVVLTGDLGHMRLLLPPATEWRYLYKQLDIQPLSEAQLLARLLLPSYELFSGEQRLQLMTSIKDRWSRLRGCKSLQHVLRTVTWVPVNTTPWNLDPYSRVPTQQQLAELFGGTWTHRAAPH